MEPDDLLSRHYIRNPTKLQMIVCKVQVNKPDRVNPLVGSKCGQQQYIGKSARITKESPWKVIIFPLGKKINSLERLEYMIQGASSHLV